ncbi:MAG: gliding motility protein GldL [Prevotella sp.]|uniref:type IX secretion system motor protein PorL/GldL n=1 Tax=Leyella stercorea TaxID=363265 RepID=UPI0025CDF540|nr:gliding motility protein GldL [Prevotella sp.]MCI6489117.1 gliding motility protein GldL [Prevotella sp.]MDD7644924.1 gliding motility protein GldL [Leyella stercorea]MDY4089414.1 gliding motility protein GldL [Prevotella sp.]
MTIYSKFNIVYHLQKWMDSVPGQTFLNYAYSWGASVVILGTLFKLTHLPGANIMLFAGMGTEVFVFFISAFDRPFDKTQEGRDLPTHIDEEEIDREEAEAEAAYNAGVQGSVIIGGGAAGSGAGVAGSGAGVSGGGTIIIGGGAASAAASATAPASEGAAQTVAGGTQTVAGGTQTVVSSEAAQTAAAAAELAANHEVAMQLADAQANYLDELKRLTETLQKVSDQSVRLTRDSEEMENLNRTLTGICKIYEMQLKGASQQIGTIDQINEQSKRMAEQIEQLNGIYARMIEAMTVNMNLKVKE